MKREIVLGPPGTGKTTTLLNRVDDELSRGTHPRRIGYLSFTRRAAEEAVTRACDKFSMDRKDFRWFRTIHSLCFQSLGYKREDVLNGVKLTRDFAQYARTTIDARWLEDGTLVGHTPGSRAIHLINLARIRMVTLRHQYDTYPEEPGVSWSETDRVAKCLTSFKREHGYVDFTDMFEEFVKSRQTLDLDVLFVDEAQDLSKLAWTVVNQLAATCRRVIVAGDDDQAIFGWAGADVDGFIGLDGEVEVLGQSWRVPRGVQLAADHLISKVKNRRPKTWAARDEEGDVERSFGLPDLAGDDVMILARNNHTLAEIEDDLKLRGVVYKIGDRPSVAKSVSDAIVTWERLRRGQAVSVDDARTVYSKMTVRKGVEWGYKSLKDLDPGIDVTIEDLRSRGGLLADGPWFEALDMIPRDVVGYVKTALQAGESLTKPPRVRLMTIHGAKGGEADHVVLMLECARRSYENGVKFPDEELRVWYVGVTRARRKLTLVEAPTENRCRWL